jgi:hypothetical protein
MDAAYTAPPEVGRFQQLSLIVGVVCLALVGVGVAVTRNYELFFRSYLTAYVFWIGIALGSLAVLMLQHLTGGAWGLVSRRVLESAAQTIPLMLVLFVPLALGIHVLYEWSHPHEVAADPVLAHKARYLVPWFFLVRAGVYFAIWLALSYLLNKWSGDQDRTADRGISRRFRLLSGPGLVLFVLTVTFASFDWVMSLDPHWYSTVFGLLFVAGWGLSAFAFVIAALVWLSTRKPLQGVVAPSHFHDLGKLLLAFVMVWAYLSFSQYLIIWSGNIPEEARWYLHRQRGGWGVVAVLLISFQFALPFLLLLSRDLKRNARLLAGVAGLVLFMRLVDLFWLIAPEVPKTAGHHLNISWMDVLAPVGLGGIWLWFFATRLKKRPLLPFNDPYLEDAIEQGARHGH